MALVKSILIVDGENLTFRYQEILKTGRKPKDDVIHIPDVFVWHRDISRLWMLDFYRVLFYSSVVGDEPKIREIKDAISKQIFHEDMNQSHNYFGKLQIVPWIFKKESKSHKVAQIKTCRYQYHN